MGHWDASIAIPVEFLWNMVILYIEDFPGHPWLILYLTRLYRPPGVRDVITFIGEIRDLLLGDYPIS